MKKYIFYILIILIFINTLSFVFEVKKTEAAVPTIKTVNLIKSNKNTSGKWNWEFYIETTNVVNGTKMVIDIYKGSTKISSTQENINDNYLDYFTGYTLDDNSLYVIFFTIANSNPVVKKTYSATTGGVNQNIPPIILNFSPSEGSIGNKININGNNFNGTTNVLFGGVEANNITVDSDTKIRAEVPIGTLDGKITITTPKGSVASSDIFKISVIPTDITPINDTSKPDIYKLLAPIGTLKEAPTDIGTYFNTIFNIAIGLCGVLAVIMIVIGGVQYMGDESVFGKTDAKDRIYNAVLGLLIALGSFALLNTINPDLLGGTLSIKSVSAGIEEAPIISDENTSTPTGTANSFPPGCPGGVNKVSTKGGHFIVCSTYASTLQLMFSDAYSAGIILTGGGFRTAEAQIQARIDNKCPDIYNSPASDCTPDTAKPGTSLHEQGLAWDLRCDGNLINWDDQQPSRKKTPATKKCFDWLTKNQKKYQIKNFTKENWHWSTGANAGH
jgi:hypothetical protein